jgi:hypothetical protein
LDFQTVFSKRNQRYFVFRTNIFLGTKSRLLKKEEIVEKPEKENEEETDVERKVTF